MNQLRQLLRDETAGDPMARRGLWTGLRLEQISHQLGLLGLSVCPNTVRRLLQDLDYALHANRQLDLIRRPVHEVTRRGAGL